MNPFIFQFKEQPNGEDSDFSSIAYDPLLNLSVNIVTNEPAVSYFDLSTETSTKDRQENSDSDRNNISHLMGTEFVTLVKNETVTSDRDRLSLSMLIGTGIETRQSLGSTDHDSR